MPDLTGMDVGRYHIIQRLGQGGMAEVYKAFDTRLQREVALKVIRKDMIAQAYHDTMMKRFEREALALARLSHPNIVKVFDFGEYDEAPFLVMEYLTGGTLSLKAAGKPLHWQEASHLLAPVASALEYAHSEGILHRDVKPANILLTRQGQPMLSDFGIAKIMDMEGTTQLTGTSMGIGTPEYMAPEQWGGKPVAQTDIYALGVVFFELITGKRPYTADTPFAVMRKQLTDPLPRPSQIIPDIPERVEQVLFKALARETKDRYASMAEFAAMLDKLAMGQGVSAPVYEITEAFPDQTMQATRPEKPTPPPEPAAPRVVSTQVDSAPIPVASKNPQATQAASTPIPVDRRTTAATQVDSAPIPVEGRPVAATRADSTPISPSTGPVAIPEKRSGKRNPVWIIIGLAVGALLVVVVLAGLGGMAWNNWFSPSAQTRMAATARAAYYQTAAVKPTETIFVTLTSTIVPTPLGGTTRMISKDGMSQVWVAPGDFAMGSYDNEDEQPLHKVSLDAFWMDKTEITNGMYALCVSAGGCKEPISLASKTHPDYYTNPAYKDYPVIYIDWNMAKTYCEFYGRRLPTEAEWEKAARSPDHRTYPWGNNVPICPLVNEFGCSGDTNQVASRPDGASPYGVLDMAGNVSEWVADWYGSNYFQSSPIQNPLGPASGQYHVAKGGSFMNKDKDIRSAKRYLGEQVDPDLVGFRCAQTK